MDLRRLIEKGTGSDRLASLTVSSAYLLIFAVYSAVAIVKYPYRSWFTGADQEWYLKAAKAWSIGDLDPSQHYYPPGYPLLGAPFVRLFPQQPFLVPDLICILAVFWLFLRICRELLGDTSRGQLFGTVAFLIAFVSSPKAVTVWIWPWSTTGSAPFVLGALLGTLRFNRTPQPRIAFLTMLGGGAVALFRPTDAVIVLAAVGLFMSWTLIDKRAPPRQIGTCITTAVVGVMIPLLVFAAIHVSIFGPARGEYLTRSAHSGFNLALLPWRWVALAIDPRPLFPEGAGLAEVFPWIVPGIAGMALFLLPSKSGRLAPHILVIGTMAAY